VARIVVFVIPGVIRIDLSREGPTLVMRIAGVLAGGDVSILRDAIARDGVPDRLDLAEVEFVDSDGATALLALEARGTALVGAEPYVELLLRAPPGSPPN
jgi:hypothetical protein